MPGRSKASPRQGKVPGKLEERSRVRAGTSAGLSPNFSSVDVVRMMVEGEQKEERKIREWASEASGLVAIAVPGPQGQKGMQSVRSFRSARFLPFSLDWTHLALQKWRALLLTHSHPLLLLFCYERLS